jgi:phosphohistidine phosphatase SixA
MHVRILLILLSCCFIGNANAGNKDESFTLYLVRHAEKQADNSRDPALTQAGKQRSEQLAAWLQDKDIQDIWSSNYIRTRDTAMPMLSDPELELSIYDPHDLAALTKNLLEKQHNAVIVGHSNTTPELARSLCHCDIEDMDESEYDRLIVVSFANGEARTETLQQRRLSQ